jgi:hypothetical protein
MVVKAKHIPDKPLEEPNEKPATSKAHPIIQGLHQTGSLDISDPKTLLAPILPLIDLAPASIAKCIITYDVPYCRAINTSSWAALAMCPDTTFPNANSSMAVNWHATSGHTSHINEGAIC